MICQVTAVICRHSDKNKLYVFFILNLSVFLSSSQWIILILNLETMNKYIAVHICFLLYLSSSPLYATRDSVEISDSINLDSINKTILTPFNCENTDINDIRKSYQEKNGLYDNSKEEENLWLSLSDIINTAIGALLGFGSAFYLQYHLIRRKRQKSIENIVLELKDIRNTLEKWKDDTTIPPIFGYALFVPVWDAIIGNGDVIELKNKPYYNSLFIVYSNVLKLQKMENWLYENYQICKNNDEYIKNIILQRKKVYSILTSTNYSIVDLFNDFNLR